MTAKEEKDRVRPRANLTLDPGTRRLMKRLAVHFGESESAVVDRAVAMLAKSVDAKRPRPK